MGNGLRKLLWLLPLLASLATAQVTKGTAVTLLVDPANTTGTSGSTYTAGANALTTCVVNYDDNGSGTTVSSISVGGSPTYSTAWARVPSCSGSSADGRLFDAANLGTEIWRAVTSSGFTNQAFTVTISTSERFAAVCQSYTGEDTATPIAACQNSKTAATADPTVTVTSSSNDNSLYAGGIGCGTNSGRTITAGSGYTIDASVNMDSSLNKWVHASWESKNAAVTPASNTVVNATLAACDFTHIFGIEIKKATAGGTCNNRIALLGAGCS